MKQTSEGLWVPENYTEPFRPNWPPRLQGAEETTAKNETVRVGSPHAGSDHWSYFVPRPTATR